MEERSPKPKAYSYVRFSTGEQAKGDSLRRQTAMAEEYARRHDLDLDRELVLRDPGVSAFNGDNAAVGALGAFLKLVENGIVPPGSQLLVENIDRLSRQTARRVVRLVEDLCNAGIAVVTLSDGRVYTAQTLDEDDWALMYLVMSSMRAHDESRVKARRLKAAWEGKRLRAGDRPLTSKGPAWLHLDKVAGRWEPIEERVAVVQRIYTMAAEGLGQHTIAETLNAEGVATFGYQGRKPALYWHRSYIKKLLESEAVGGRFTPHRVERGGASGRVKVRIPEREHARDGYFPAIIPKDLLGRVRRLQEGAKPRQSPNRPRKVSTFLAGLVRCGGCGGAMVRVNKGVGGGRPYLACARARAKALPKCTMPSAPLVNWEFDLAHHFAYHCGEVYPEADEELAGEVDRLQRKEHVLGDVIDNLVEALGRGRGVSPALTGKLREAEEERGQVRKELEALTRRLGQGSAALATKAIRDVRVFFQKEVDGWETWDVETLAAMDHHKANTLLRGAVNRIVVKGDGTWEVHWKDAGVQPGDPGPFLGKVKLGRRGK